MKIEGKEYRTIWFERNIVKIIDQTKLPHKFIIKELKTIKDAVKGVIDIQYMDGRIEREVSTTGKKYTLVEGRTGADLVQEVTRNLADSGQSLV